jgi:hypothetical protein
MPYRECYCCGKVFHMDTMSVERHPDGQTVWVCEDDACHEYWATSVIGG